MQLEQVGCVWGPQSLIVEVMETEESAGLWRSVGNQLRKIYCYVYSFFKTLPIKPIK